MAMTFLEPSTSNHLTLAHLVPRDGIELNLKAPDKQGAIECLLDRLVESDAVKDWEQVLDDILARERQGSTGLGRGVAMPHAKTSGVQQPALAFGRSAVGLDFDALDGNPVHLIFLLIVPRTKAGFHLKVLAALNRFLREESHRRQLLEASKDAVVRQLLEQVKIPQ